MTISVLDQSSSDSTCHTHAKSRIYNIWCRDSGLTWLKQPQLSPREAEANTAEAQLGESSCVKADQEQNPAQGK